ncbi:hypothetical protein CN918_29025 [Priestia megaterium]|nr:hypothetical protein CN918_29025 [Priestia megaterium]
MLGTPKYTIGAVVQWIESDKVTALEVKDVICLLETTYGETKRTCSIQNEEHTDYRLINESKQLYEFTNFSITEEYTLVNYRYIFEDKTGETVIECTEKEIEIKGITIEPLSPSTQAIHEKLKKQLHLIGPEVTKVMEHKVLEYIENLMKLEYNEQLQERYENIKSWIDEHILMRVEKLKQLFPIEFVVNSDGVQSIILGEGSKMSELVFKTHQEENGLLNFYQYEIEITENEEAAEGRYQSSKPYNEIHMSLKEEEQIKKHINNSLSKLVEEYYNPANFIEKLDTEKTLEVFS